MAKGSDFNVVPCGLLFLTLAVATILTTFIPDAAAYPRKVFVDIFTNTGCPLTPIWIPPAEREAALFGEDACIQVTYHTWWPLLHDPWYMDNFERHLPGVDDIQHRVAFYGYDQFLGVPSFFYDGHRIRYGNPMDGFLGEIRDYIGERLDTETPVHIEISAEVDGSDLATRVVVVSDETLANLTLFTALCERYIYYRAPSGQRDFYGNLLELIPDAEGRTFRLPAGQGTVFEFESTIDVGWNDNSLDNLFVAAWIHNEELEVLQAEKCLLGVAEPTVLVVDATGNPAAGIALYELFGSGSAPFADRWIREDDGEVPGNRFGDYEAVFWHSFNNEENLISGDEAEALIDYLDAGGTVVMSCPYLGEVIGNSLLYQRYLSLAGDNEDIETYVVSGYDDYEAFEGCRVYLGGDGGAGRPGITPLLVPRDDAYPVMYYEEDGENIGVAAVVHETDRYRVLTLAFPIESADGVGGTEHRRELLARICNWIEHPQAAPEQESQVTGDFSLSAPYPNPFNSQTTVKLTLETASKVNIDIYNTNGRRVFEIADGWMNAGTHQVIIDASGAGLTTGVFFIRCRKGNSLTSRKILFLQ